MSSTIVKVPAGQVSAIIPLLANQNICVGPAVQGGSVTINVASNPAGPFLASAAGTTLFAQSYRPDINQYVQVAALTQAADGVISDMAIPNMQGNLISLQAPIDSANSTAEQVLFSFKLAPGTLPANFRCTLSGKIAMTNGANAKTLQVRMNGLAGTLIFQSPALASNADYNFEAWLSGIGDGATLEGFGAGSAGGFGLSTTAYTTLARAYQQLETEIVVTCTKATGTDTMTLSSLNVTLS